MLVPTVQSRSIENIKVTTQKTINTQEVSTYGCCMMSNGRLAFTSYFKVIIFDMNGLKEFELRMPCVAYDIVNISEDNALAVTSGASAKTCISIIDLERKQIKKTIPLDSENYGITLKDNRLVYSTYDKGIRMINLLDDSKGEIVRVATPSDCYTATFRDKIYHTNRETSTVTCYNLQGEIQWTFLNKSVLKNPRGIDVDSDGNVYVVGFSSNNLVVISSDGQRHREVLTTDDGLNYPVSLHYSGPKNQLLIANFNNKAHLFNVI
ncbi:unnamed protein product [Mytilus coruscus]|uniref:SMP-30/Gluconolactonase/LRE-like region domain-containing protein n=1 Tax=Mytilus coruscus TaxID=42192 RepID=A0A6J8E8T4_MYTCO|nr:unnamed protein product [Mytilus coruscus]